MSRYRRLYIAGGCYFFTVVVKDRLPIFSSRENVLILKRAFRYVMKKYPFNLDALVILPDHLHCIWTLPDNEDDFALRWRLIKAYFSKRLGRSVWQHRYWEHLIRNERDWKVHCDYIHFNPIKHRVVDKLKDWPWSTFHYFLRMGLYPSNWGEIEPPTVEGLHFE